MVDGGVCVIGERRASSERRDREEVGSRVAGLMGDGEGRVEGTAGEWCHDVLFVEGESLEGGGVMGGRTQLKSVFGC